LALNEKNIQKRTMKAARRNETEFIAMQTQMRQTQPGHNNKIFDLRPSIDFGGEIQLNLQTK
jgi:hypothetical protein